MPPKDDSESGAPPNGKNGNGKHLPPHHKYHVEVSEEEEDGQGKQGFFIKFFNRIPTVWKVITIIAAIFSAGAAGHSYLNAYTARYATREDLAAHTVTLDMMKKEIEAMQRSDIARSADILSIKADTAAVREDMRTILQHILATPPVRTPTK